MRKKLRMTSKFQFTPLREGRRLHLGLQFFAQYFNSRPSARGDQYYQRYLFQKLFQFTPLREGRRRGESLVGSGE